MVDVIPSSHSNSSSKDSSCICSCSGRRQVHFVGLDWKEEERRSERGVQQRQKHRQEKKERKKQLKMAAIHNRRLALEAFEVLRDPGRLDRVLALCGRLQYIILMIHSFLKSVNIEFDGGDDFTRNMRTRLQRLQADPEDNLVYFARLSSNRTSFDLLVAIRNLRDFVDEFFARPGRVSDSSSEGDEELANELEQEMLQADQNENEQLEQQQPPPLPEAAIAAAAPDAEESRSRRRPDSQESRRVRPRR